jgi:hypothetical protein
MLALFDVCGQKKIQSGKIHLGYSNSLSEHSLIESKPICLVVDANSRTSTNYPINSKKLSYLIKIP